MTIRNAVILHASVTPSADSRWFAGHFPDQAILPGVAQLALVWELVSALPGNAQQLTGLRRVKFKKIVVPGEQLDIHAEYCDKEGKYFFRILSGETEVCCGTMACDSTGR